MTRLFRAVILLICAMSVMAVAQNPLPNGNQAAVAKHFQQRGDQYLYGHFFSFVTRINAEADQADRDGMNSQYLRSYFQNKAALNPTQTILLNQTASDLATQLSQYDAKADELRTKRHVLVQTNRANGDAIPPVPPQILGLEAGREALILQARDRLRLNLGDQEFARLDAYVRATAPWNHPIIPPPSGLSAQKPSAAALDRIVYVSLFRSVAYFKAKAEEERKLGLTKVTDSLTTLVQRQAGLTPEQFQILDRVATEYLQAYDSSAKQLQAAQLPYKKLVLEMLARDGKVTSMPELAAAQKSCEAIAKQMDDSADAAIQRLRTAYGEDAFAKLDSFVKRTTKLTPSASEEVGR